MMARRTQLTPEERRMLDLARFARLATVTQPGRRMWSRCARCSMGTG